MTGKKDGQKWIAPAAMSALSLVIAFASFSGIQTGMFVIPVLLACLVLPVACAVTATLYGWPLTAAMCVLAAVSGWKVLPGEALPAVLFWCTASGLTACIPMKKRLLRPVMRTGMCLAAWGIGLFILLRLTGGQIVTGIAQGACDYIERSPDGTEILMQAYSAGYVRLQSSGNIAPVYQLLGTVMIPAETRTQMLLSLRVSLEEILPGFLCSAVVYHTALTVFLSTILPDWLRRKRGEHGEFAPMEQWFMPRGMGLAVFALSFGWIVAMVAEEGIGAYLGWLCAGVFRAAFILQGICWMQWLGKRMGIRSTVRNIWSVILSFVMPLIPMIMGMIDQRRDSRHLRPKEEADQE